MKAGYGRKLCARFERRTEASPAERLLRADTDESVEQRGRALGGDGGGKNAAWGNSDQEAAVRTQSRVAASNVLMAVRRMGQQEVDTRCLVRPHLVQ